jgi:hypothetical protein
MKRNRSSQNRTAVTVCVLSEQNPICPNCFLHFRDIFKISVDEKYEWKLRNVKNITGQSFFAYNTRKSTMLRALHLLIFASMYVFLLNMYFCENTPGNPMPVELP